MREFWAGALALAAVLTVGAADAADMRMPYYEAAAPINSYSWTGPYLGGNLGYQWGNTTRNPTNPAGIAGGVQGGFNWQTGQFVFGTEADITASAAEDTFAPWKFSNPWFGTLRARAGFALNNILVYATGGFAFGSGHLQAFGATESHLHGGWTAGAGLEVGLTRNWSARVEYLFVSLGDQSYALTGANNGFDSSVLRMGVNYRF
jgi:outer membrane immunogenic protein